MNEAGAEKLELTAETYSHAMENITTILLLQVLAPWIAIN